MEKLTLLPRYKRQIPYFQQEDLFPLPITSELLNSLPSAITAATGKITTYEQTEQGKCNLILYIEAEKGSYILKIAKGSYRGAELEAEHTIMQELQGTGILVPHSYVYVKDEPLTYQLRERMVGAPLNKYINRTTNNADVYRQFGEMLHHIHSISLPDASGELWLSYCLSVAEKNMQHDVIDTGEFVGSIPKDVLVWLRTNTPGQLGSVLLHGDYRPKNILWNNNHISGVLDWAFVDFGDPYYDLAVATETLTRAEDLQSFLEGYGLDTLDQQKLEYMQNLVKFINV